MGDFIGFTFGGVSSSSLGITRVSGGDRYDEELHPEIKDITAEVAGVNGEYYFGSTYGTKTIDLELAFDSLTEAQFRTLRKTFGTREIKSLIFDERPYKQYMAKLESPMELSYVCFDEPRKTIDNVGRSGVRVSDRTYGSVSQITSTNEDLTVDLNLTTFKTQIADSGTYSFIYSDDDSSWTYNEEEISLTDYGITCTGTPVNEDTIIVVVKTILASVTRETVKPYNVDHNHIQRIYKGEGKLSFVCYFPFAKSVYKVLPEGSDDWAISSGILSATDYAQFDTYDTTTSKIKVYNPGDIPTGFCLYLPSAIATNNSGITVTYKADGSNVTASLVLDKMTMKSSDVGVLIDTNNELIIGVSEINNNMSGNAKYTTSGNIYNEYVSAGYFFHLETNENKNDGSVIELSNGNSNVGIFYDYLYF